jgi:DNA-binding response OmpR family regulator
MTGRRILVVEDEALIALFTTDLLTKAGYAVIGPADRLETGLELARNETFDAALLDVNLDGAVVWPIAELLVARGIPFVLLSGYGAALDLPAFCRHAPCLAKPARRNQLIDAIARLF